MATVTMLNGIEVLPSIGDLAEVFNGLVVTSSNSSAVVMENAFGRVTFNAASAFTFSAGQTVPAGGTVASVQVEAYSAASSLVDFMNVDYGAGPVQVATLMAVYGSDQYGYTLYLNTDTIFAGNDVVNGTAAADWLQGRGGNDSITGGAGDDTLDGAGATSYYGADTLVGGAGDDVYIVRNVSSDTIVEASGAGSGNDTAVLFSGGTWTMPDNVENLEIAPAWLIGSAYSYSSGVVTGNSLANIMRGGLYANDNLMGMEGADRLFGLGGNDTLDGGAGADLMVGGDGDDTYYVDSAGDKVFENTTAGAGYVPGVVSGDTVISLVNYTLPTFVENLTLSGSANISGSGNALNNFIVGNNGNNGVDGGGGIDTLSFQTAVTKVTANLGSGVATGGGGSDTISNIENLVGGSAGDDLKGASDANRLDGGAGADTLTGLGGDDTYVVDNAGDVLAEGVDKGVDLVESSVNWTLADNFENLNLTGGYNSINGTGNAADNVIVGNYGANTILGGDGNDTIRAAPLYYSSYGDSLDGGAGNDSITGSYGNDTILGGAQVDILYGEYGNDLLDGGTASDALHGGYNDDTLDGGAGADTMDGSYGSDTYYVDNAGDLVIDVQETDLPQYNIYYTNTVIASVNYALPYAIDNLVMTGSAARGAGNYLDNVITVNTGAVSNVLNGGRGVDTLSYDGTVAGVTVSLAVTGAQATGGSGSDAIRNFENLTGGSGNDSLSGNAGANVLNGGAGNDTLAGGKGDDVYLVDSAQDVVTELSAGGTDTVRTAATGVTLGAQVENLVIVATGNADATGNASNNLMLGNAYANLLVGLGGNDTLDGGAGADTMDGGAGNDVFVLNMMADQVLDSGGKDLVRLSSDGFWYQTYLMPDAIENLEFVAPGYFYGGLYANATGNDKANLMRGSDGANALSGGGGADTLAGGGGYDTLTGGTGADVFLFDTPLLYPYDSGFNAGLHGYDMITDFAGIDKIALDDEIFVALPSVAAGGFTAKNLAIGAEATTADHRIVYDSSSGAMYYDPDGSGAQAAIQFASLSPGLTLSAANFIVT